MHVTMNTLLPAIALFLGTQAVAFQDNFLGQRALANTSKAGLAWPNADRADIRQYETTGKVSWYYPTTGQIRSASNNHLVLQVLYVVIMACHIANESRVCPYAMGFQG